MDEVRYGIHGFNQPEILADVREAFQQLEAAISAARPSGCRPFVGAALYEQVEGLVDELAAHGHRRVHGSFEIHDVNLIDVETQGRVLARVHASSSIAQLDRHNRIVDGSFDLKRWAQDVTAKVEEPMGAQPHWMITELGELSVEGDVTGPLHQPMDPARRQALDDERRKREREDDEFWAALRTVSRNFLTAVGSA
jgi:hypothetical protein